jgi:hypothetical protein
MKAPSSRSGNMLRGKLKEPNQKKKAADENETRTF